MRIRKLITAGTALVFLLYPSVAGANPVSPEEEFGGLISIIFYGIAVFVILAVSIKLIRMLAGKINKCQTAEPGGDPGDDEGP